MIFAYNLLIIFYGCILNFISFKNKKVKLMIDGRKNCFKYLNEHISSIDKIIWIHCSSMGEFEQARPLISKLKSKLTSHKILVTFYSSSGYEAYKNYELIDFKCYLPLDTKHNAKQFVKIVRPELTFFIKYDFWPNYLLELQNQNLNHYIISAIFRNNQFFMKKSGQWMLQILKKVSHFFVQNEDSKYLLLTKNINKVTNVGDTRFDRVLDIIKKSESNPIIKEFKDVKPLFIGGSTWNKGEEMIFEFINHYKNKFKYIIAPHEINYKRLSEIEAKLNVKSIRYSHIKKQKLKNFDVILIDKIGLLSSIYKYGDISYIGGGFGKGIHNTLEAACFGMPIFIGPNNSRFQEAKDLKKIGVAIEIKSCQKMIAFCDYLLTKSGEWEKIKNKSSNYVKDKTGATEKIISKLFGNTYLISKI